MADARFHSRVPALMVQGTCSDAGKSLVTAALCRLLARRGLRVAPFKAQNMALNSFVTLSGEEMGRAQALQAVACGLEPDARMNPVLLKPTSDQGSQVIVRGRPVGMMRVRDYIAYKPTAWKAVRAAYAELAAENDVLVLEGAGSPAEINLRRHDIVNMRMAAHAGAAVLLLADIDRGGAFAALAGTMSLLGRADRARVAGFALNRFRGDAGLLAPAMEAVSRRTRRPFFGVIPMIPDLRLPEEDSVSFKLGKTPGLGAGAPGAAPRAGALDVALIDLPHISNVTDCDALRAEPGVRLRVVRRPEELGAPALVILPGSRNTLADMGFLRASGLARAITAHARACLARGGGAVAGICGGLQLLGARILDPHGLEGSPGSRGDGLGLLPLVTELAAAKTLRRTRGTALAPLAGAALPVAGYEIHHGLSRCAGARAVRVVMEDAGARPLGWGLVDAWGTARIWGTYLHGVFDSDAFRHALLGRLRREAGLPGVPGAAWALGPELDRVADVVGASLDMGAIDALLGL